MQDIILGNFQSPRELADGVYLAMKSKPERPITDTMGVDICAMFLVVGELCCVLFLAAKAEKLRKPANRPRWRGRFHRQC